MRRSAGLAAILLVSACSETTLSPQPSTVRSAQTLLEPSQPIDVPYPRLVSWLEERPLCATINGETLALWSDHRYAVNSSGPKAIFGARISTSDAGSLLDLEGFPVLNDAEFETSALAPAGDHYLVAFPYSFYPPPAKPELHWWWIERQGSRASASGAVNDRVRPGSLNAAYDGRNNLLTWWSDSEPDAGARTQLIGPIGYAIGPPQLVGAGYPAAAGMDGGFVLVWAGAPNAHTIQGTSVTPEGIVRRHLGLPVAAAESSTAPSIASNGDIALVAWASKSLLGWAVSCVRLAADGSPRGSQIVLAQDTAEFLAPQVSRLGNDFLVVWNQPGKPYADSARVQADGTFSLQTLPGDFSRTPRLCGDSKHTVAVWDDGARASYLPIDPPFRVLAPSRPLNTIVNNQEFPVIASNGSGYLVAWVDDRNGASIFMNRLTATGAQPNPYSDEVTRPSIKPSALALASSGSTYLLVWREDLSNVLLRVRALRLNATSMLDATPIDVAFLPQGTVLQGLWVAGGGDRFLIIWQQLDPGSPQPRLLSRTMDVAGHVLGTGPVELQAQPGQQTQLLAAGAIAGRFLVAPEYGPFIELDLEGNVLDAGLFSGLPVRMAPALVGLGDRALLVDLSGATEVARILASDGGVSPEISIGPGSVNSRFSSATYDGRSFLVASGTGPAMLSRIDDVSRAVDLPDPFLAPVTGIASSGGSISVLVRREATRLGPSMGRVTMQVMKNFPVVLGSACQANLDCQSGNCADGVCCDTTCGGSKSWDCLACSRDAGAAVDGTCGVVTRPGVVCRSPNYPCELPQTCDGISTDCPTSLRYRDAGAVCFKQTGWCRIDVVCNGGATCNGPSDAPFQTPCFEAGSCVVGQYCSSGSCVGGTRLDAGTPCDDGDPCTLAERCDSSGVCKPSSRIACPSTDCLSGVCSAGSCTQVAVVDGTRCDGGQCLSGLCSPDPLTEESPEPVDGGHTADAGEADAGFDDAGVDAGQPPFESPDAGRDPAPQAPHGCGCSSAVDSSAAIQLMVMLVLAARLRRSRTGGPFSKVRASMEH